MDESLSGSESDFFESAEESLDEDDGETNGNELERNERFTDKETIELEKSAVRGNKSNCKEDPSGDRNRAIDSVAYRKRPEKPKQLSSCKAVKKTNFCPSRQSVFRTDVIDLQDISTNLTKNINRSLNSLQQTSSNVKDLFMNSLPGTVGSSQNEVFSYDDEANFALPSPPKGDCPFDKTFSQLSLSDVLSVAVSETNSEVGSINEVNNEFNVKNLDKSKSNYESDLLKPKTDLNSLLSDKKYDEKKKKLFSSDLQKKFNIPEVSEFFDLGLVGNSPTKSVTNTAKEKNTPLFTNNFELKKTIFDNVHLVADSKGDKLLPEMPIKQCSDDNNPEAKTKSSVLPKEIKKKHGQQEKPDSELESKKIPIVPLISHCELGEEKNVSFDTIRVTESDKQFSKFKEKKCFDDKTAPSSVRKPESFAKIKPSHSSYSGEKKLLGSLKPSRKEKDEVNQKDAKLTLDQINWNDPECDLVNEKDGEDWEDFTTTPSSRREKKIEEDSDVKEASDASKGITEKVKINSELECQKDSSEMGCRIEVKSSKANDGWNDFDFSDSENDDFGMNASLYPKMDEWKGSFVKIAEKLHGDPSETKLNSSEINRASQNGLEDGIAIVGTSNKSEDQNQIIEDDETEQTDWSWDAWGDEEDSEKKKEEKVESEKPKLEGNLGAEIWSGWDAFSQKMEEKQSNWGSWGMNVLIDKAAAVTQGISSALEAGLGAPDPETLAKMEKKLESKPRKGEEEEFLYKNSLTDVKLFSTLVDVTSKIVENSKFQEIGSKVISGGLDTLEIFGKKTMEILQEGDPGLKSKRSLFSRSEKSNLSQALKEIREKAEKEMRETEEKEMNRRCHFESLFDDFEGLVHLEALEMLSTRCDLKLEQIRIPMSPEEREDLNGVLEEVEQLCSLDDCDLTLTLNNGNFNKSLGDVVEPLREEISVARILEIKKDAEEWLQSSLGKGIPAESIHQKLVSTLAQLTAAVIHQFHKVGELLSVKECRKTVEEIDALSEMTHMLIYEINHVSDGFVNLSKESLKGTDALGPLVNRIDAVRNNSTSFIKQAFNLLIPVLQLGAAV